MPFKLIRIKNSSRHTFEYSENVVSNLIECHFVRENGK